MIDNSLFSKYQQMGFKSDGTLFGVDLLDAVVKHVCPYCGNKLYEMRGKPLMYCRSVKHANRFVISKSKLK